MVSLKKFQKTVLVDLHIVIVKQISVVWTRGESNVIGEAHSPVEEKVAASFDQCDRGKCLLYPLTRAIARAIVYQKNRGSNIRVAAECVKQKG